MSQALARLARDLAVDLGTARTRIYQRGRGVLIDEPTVVALDQTESRGDLVAAGDEAHDMIGRTPSTISVVRPVKGSVIQDFAAAEALLRSFIRRTVSSAVLRPRALVAVPASLTEVERRAVHECARAAGCREVRLVHQPLVAALGSGLPLFDARGTLIVDIGAGRTEVAVLTLGGVACSASAPIGGDTFDNAIRQHLLEAHGVDIPLSQAEQLKRALHGGRPLEIRGRSASSGRAEELRLPPDELIRTISATTTAVVDLVRGVLKETPPELCADILEYGLVLCGGGAMLSGLANTIRESTGLAVLLAEHPERAVVLGAGTAVETPELLAELVLRGN